MIRPTVALGVFLAIGAPSFLGAQASSDLVIDRIISIQAIGSTFTGPKVNSFAKVTLYDREGNRLYTTPVTIGHAVGDLSSPTVLFQARISTEIGLANSRASDLPGVWNHCYEAIMGVHVNGYNYHANFSSGVDCIEPPEPHPVPEPPDENCPILLDLRQDGYHLAGPVPAVSFDIDADGIRDRIAWTKAGEDEAFLCMDRNRNGIIDDGTELFGYATPLLSGQRAQIGYRALAELDLPATGGNGDGVVDTSDEGFADLCAWVDANRDAVSQPQEIRTLRQVGVVALAYRYRTIHSTDSSGNLFRYVSWVLMRGPAGVQPWPTYDVIFAEP